MNITPGGPSQSILAGSVAVALQRAGWYNAGVPDPAGVRMLFATLPSRGAKLAANPLTRSLALGLLAATISGCTGAPPPTDGTARVED